MSKKKNKKQPKLTGGQIRFLRGMGHHLTPKAMIGKEGITDNLVGSVKDVLAVHELVKVKVQENCPLDRKEAAEEVARLTGASLVQVIGKTFLLYWANEELHEEKRIQLPR